MWNFEWFSLGLFDCEEQSTTQVNCWEEQVKNTSGVVSEVALTDV